MKKCFKSVFLCMLIAGFVWSITLMKDTQTLRKELIRLHVVGASNEEANQALKLQVRDAVIESLQKELNHVTDVSQAKAYLQNNLSDIRMVATQVLESAGCAETIRVSLGREAFPMRLYDTFALPSGVYETLRITIGEGQGRNWWCVAFPALCVGAAVEDFEQTALCAGMSESLTATLAGETDYEVRFLILDAIGKLENFIHSRQFPL